MSLASRLLGVRTADNAPATVDRTPTAATGTTGWSMPGMPQTPRWDADNATTVGYYGHVYSYRCARTIATTIGGLAFRAGRNPDTPGNFDLNAPLARLLGPPPGGPAPGISPRRLWNWSIAAYLVTGRYGWETPTDPRTGRVTSLWPLVAGRLKPIPTDGGTQFFSGYEYQMNGRVRRLQLDQAHYAWRPSQDDWREPESVLQAASLPLSTAIALDKHMYAFMKNNMVGAKMVITPEFEDTGMRRAFQDQFLSEMTGWDNAGRTAFAEWDDDGDPTNKTPSVQVVDLGTRPIDAQTIEQVRELKTDICIAYGVPVSMLGNASDRTYENADQEHRNYWTGTILPLLTELTDDINMTLAPRLGDEVGWFDLSGVEALRPAKRFIDASPIDLKNAGMIATGEWREDISLPPQLPTDPNAPLPTNPLPAVDDTPGVGGKSNLGGARAVASSSGTQQRLAAKVLAYLADNYPQRVLGWVADATWEYDPAVPLTHIKMGRRPGARDPEKTAAITEAVKAGKTMDPVVLVDTGGDQLEIADGYHRTLAFAHDGRTTIPAYVASGVGENGPWERDMHDAKLNRSAQDELAELLVVELDGMLAGARYNDAPFSTSTTSNWVARVGGLPPYARAVARGIMRAGHTESQAIHLAIGVLQNWASGRGNVSAKTRAKAAAAIAQWETMKAASHAKRDALLESSSAGALLPVAGHPMSPVPQQAHLPTVGAKRGLCGRCGQPASAAIHRYGRSSRRRKGHRHAGPGHQPVVSGHTSHTRNKRLAEVHREANSLEPAFVRTLTGLFADQKKATLDRLVGKRGKQMLTRAATPPTEPPAPGEQASAEEQGKAPIVDAAQIYDLAHWIERTRGALDPVFTAVQSVVTDRLGRQFGEDVTQNSLGAVRHVLDERLRRLAESMTRTTFDQVAQVLRTGVTEGQSVEQMTTALEGVFDKAQRNRAPMIARTETLGSINQAAHAYAAKAGPHVVAGREWLSAHDIRVRHTHREADGQIRPMGEPYLVGGAPMQFPHDPAAPPDEVINCRCTEAYLTPAEYAKHTQTTMTEAA